MMSKKSPNASERLTSPPLYLLLKYPYFFLTLLVVLVYARTLKADFIHFDDTIFIIDMKDFLGRWYSVIESFSRGVFNSGMYYRPILLIDFVTEYHIFGDNATGYHFTNVLFHVIAVLLFFHLMLEMKTKDLSALILAALFAVHPVLSSAVIWIPGRNDVLLSISIWAASILFINWIEKGKKQQLILFLIMSLLSLFTKRNCVVASSVSGCLHFIAYRYKTQQQ